MILPGMILAGGLSRRMGAEKALMPLAGRPLLAHVIARAEPQLSHLALNANGDPARFARFGLPVRADSLAGHPGPLAGVLAAMDWAAELGAERVFSLPVDTPLLPGDLVPRLLLASEAGEGPVLAASADATGALRAHPTCALWPVALRQDLRAAVLGGQRRMMDWAMAQGARLEAFPAPGADPFLNVNDPQDLDAVEHLFRAG